MTTAVAFGNLYQACKRYGIHVRLSTFDGGQTIRATWLDSGGEIVRLSSQWGDMDAPSMMASYLMLHGYLKQKDLEG